MDTKRVAISYDCDIEVEFMKDVKRPKKRNRQKFLESEESNFEEIKKPKKAKNVVINRKTFLDSEEDDIDEIEFFKDLKPILESEESDFEEIEDINAFVGKALENVKKPKKPRNVGNNRKNFSESERHNLDLDCQVDINRNLKSKSKKSAKSKTTYGEEELLELFLDINLERAFELKHETSIIQPRFEVPQKYQKVPKVYLPDFNDSEEPSSTTSLSNGSTFDESEKTCNVIIPDVIAPELELDPECENIHIQFDDNVNVEYIHSWKSSILEEIMERYD